MALWTQKAKALRIGEDFSNFCSSFKQAQEQVSNLYLGSVVLWKKTIWCMCVTRSLERYNLQ